MYFGCRQAVRRGRFRFCRRISAASANLRSNLGGKEDVLPFDRGTAAQEEFAQFRRVILLVLARIEPKENAAPGIEVPIQVVQKETPLDRPPPPILLADPVKIGRERRD